MCKEMGPSIIDKIVQERIELLNADPEFIELCQLVPKILIGKESGKDYHAVTTDPEYATKRNSHGEKVIVLSARDWDRYERFERFCDKLAQKWGLHWATVENLAIGIEQPTVSPRQYRTITGGVDPLVFLPKDFNPAINYVAHSAVVPPLEAVEIMRRIEGLDNRAREEIRAYLFSLFKEKYGCRILELSEAEGSSEQPDDKVELDVWLRVPIGYTAKEVAQAYRAIDTKRRNILASLGTSVPKRRRQSQLLMEADTLELLERGKNTGILAIVDNFFPHGDVGQDQTRRRAIINKRYKAKKLIKKRRQK